ncbi:MAG: hypothetical protein J7K22_00970 [Nanoarchaeota archaeon]|nr:hypothetical protein [Nanoarchaeota archaeon]
MVCEHLYIDYIIEVYNLVKELDEAVSKIAIKRRWYRKGDLVVSCEIKGIGEYTVYADRIIKKGLFKSLVDRFMIFYRNGKHIGEYHLGKIHLKPRGGVVNKNIEELVNYFEVNL